MVHAHLQRLSPVTESVLSRDLSCVLFAVGFRRRLTVRCAGLLLRARSHRRTGPCSWSRDVVKRRYNAVLGSPMGCDAGGRGVRVSRQTVHGWQRYEVEGLARLADRSHFASVASGRRGRSDDRSAAAGASAVGPRRLPYELGRNGLDRSAPSRSTGVRSATSSWRPALGFGDASSTNAQNSRRRCRCGEWASWARRDRSTAWQYPRVDRRPCGICSGDATRGWATRIAAAWKHGHAG